jgi:hypothetical protein
VPHCEASTSERTSGKRPYQRTNLPSWFKHAKAQGPEHLTEDWFSDEGAYHKVLPPLSLACSNQSCDIRAESLLPPA